MVLCCFPVSQNVMCGKLRIHKETNFMYSDECELHPPIMNGTTLKPSKRKYQMCQMIEAMSMHYGKSDDLAKVYKRLKKGSAGFTHIEEPMIHPGLRYHFEIFPLHLIDGPTSVTFCSLCCIYFYFSPSVQIMYSFSGSAPIFVGVKVDP